MKYCAYQWKTFYSYFTRELSRSSHVTLVIDREAVYGTEFWSTWLLRSIIPIKIKIG